MAKRNLILLHGALGTSTELEPIYKRLQQEFNVFTVTFSGHGDKVSPLPFSIDLFTDDVFNFLQQEGLKKTSIFGYSMGGYVALNMAFKHPQLVDQVMTLGTKFDWNPESAEQAIRMLNPDKIEQKVPQFATHLSQMHGSNDWKSVMLKTTQMMMGFSKGQGLKVQTLEALQHQTLIMVGSNDHMVSIEESDQIATLLPRGALKIMEGFEHALEKNDLNVVCENIIDFCKSQTQ